MTSRDFCFWLQGYFELQRAGEIYLDAAQTMVIRRHLALVFAHEIDPAMGEKPHQVLLDKVHGPAFDEFLPEVPVNPADGSISGRPNYPVRYRC